MKGLIEQVEFARLGVIPAWNHAPAPLLKFASNIATTSAATAGGQVIETMRRSHLRKLWFRPPVPPSCVHPSLCTLQRKATLLLPDGITSIFYHFPATATIYIPLSNTRLTPASFVASRAALEPRCALWTPMRRTSNTHAIAIVA